MSSDLTTAVSVIMPVYRCADTLPQALRSVIDQTAANWELIAVDDGSPDDSAAIIERHADAEPRIRLLRQANAGACAARNTGIAAACGEYLLFLDADDFIEPEALAELLGVCETGGFDAAHAMHRFVKPDGSATQRIGGHGGSESLFKALSAANVLAVHDVLLRRDLLGRIGGFDSSLRHCGDWDLWQRLARSDARIGHVPKVLAGYRMRPTSLSRNPGTLLRDGIIVLRRIHGPDPRVRTHRRGLERGYDASLLPLRIAYFTLYTIGLSIAHGEMDQVTPLLDQAGRWPPLQAGDAASCLFWAICFARCQGPEQAPQFWPVLAEPVRKVCLELEKRTGQERLADETLRMINSHSGWRNSVVSGE